MCGISTALLRAWRHCLPFPSRLARSARMSALVGRYLLIVMRRTVVRAEAESARDQFRSTSWIILPIALFMVEEVAPPVWTSHEVVREIEIDAPAEAVWPLLVSIPDIGADEGQSNFTHDIAGVARPTEARLVRRRGQLVRLAEWGENIRFEEQITAIKPGRSIAWNFAFPDESIQQYTDRHIAPQGAMLHIESGRYDLVETEAGRLSLRLTTTYRMRSRMGFYLELWGEQMLGDAQDNVLAIVKQRSERVSQIPGQARAGLRSASLACAKRSSFFAANIGTMTDSAIPASEQKPSHMAMAEPPA